MTTALSSHPRIFSDRYLDKKMGNYSLLAIPDFETKLARIKEWQDWHDSKVKALNALQGGLQALDQAIDPVVYRLYQLSEAEIALVEGV